MYHKIRPLKPEHNENDQCAFKESACTQWPIHCTSRMQYKCATFTEEGKWKPIHWFNWKCAFRKLVLHLEKEILTIYRQQNNRSVSHHTQKQLIYIGGHINRLQYSHCKHIVRIGTTFDFKFKSNIENLKPTVNYQHHLSHCMLFL